MKCDCCTYTYSGNGALVLSPPFDTKEKPRMVVTHNMCPSCYVKWLEWDEHEWADFNDWKEGKKKSN